MNRALFLILFFFVVGSNASAQKVETRHDKFRGDTYISLTPSKVYEEGTNNIELSAQFMTKENGETSAISFRFIYKFSNDGSYRPPPELLALIDGDRVNFGRMERGTRDTTTIGTMRRGQMDMRHYIIEELSAVIKKEDLRRMAKAKRVEMLIGETEFALNEKQLAALKELASRLPK